MKIKNTVTSRENRAEIVSKNMKNITKEMGGKYSQFIENAQPVKCYWYHINTNHSLKGVGFQDVSGLLDGAIKFDLIKDYVVYGYVDERSVDVEQTEFLDIHYKLDNLTFLHLPNTLKPRVGDLLSLEYEEHRFLYKVVQSSPVVFHNKSYIRTVVSKSDIKKADYYWTDFKNDNLLVNIYEYQLGENGPDSTPFISTEDKNKLELLRAYKNEINNQFNEYFYDEFKNVYLSNHPEQYGFLTYIPLINDLQMEFRTLWVYGINTILTHETLVNRRTKFNYRNNIIRKFLNRLPNAWEELKSNGITFSQYPYINDISNPLYKIQSYLNDNNRYWILDYFHGENIMVDTDNVFLSFQNKTVVKIDEYFYKLYSKYTDDTLDYDWFIKWLEEYDFDMYFTDLINAFIVMAIIDKVIDKYTKQNNALGILSE